MGTQLAQRTSTARTLIVKKMQRAGKPQTLQEIHSLVTKELPSLAFSTVFRIIRALETDGTVEKIDWRDRGSRYEIRHEHHHHISCERCGRIEDIAETEVNVDFESIAASKGFVLKRHIVELIGICATCAKN